MLMLLFEIGAITNGGLSLSGLDCKSLVKACPFEMIFKVNNSPTVNKINIYFIEMYSIIDR